MDEINKRFVLLRKELGLSQRGLGDSIGLSNSGVSNIENGIRNVTDQHIKLICSELNVNEEWLRTGEGEMFVQSETFSLDEKARKHNLSGLEIDIMRGYMELPPETRDHLMLLFRTTFKKYDETAATIEVDPIEEEVESYRRELEAAQKRATLSATDEPEGKLG